MAGAFIFERAPGRLAVLLVFLCLSFSISAGVLPDNGILWKISGAAATPSYLFGTIHSEDPAVLDLAAPVKKAFASSGRVLLEILPDKEAMLSSSTAMLMMDGRLLSDLVGKSLYGKALKAMQTRDIPEVMLERMKPWAVAVTLSMPKPQTGIVLDMTLYQSALEQNKQVFGLETVMEQLGIFDNMPLRDQIVFLEDTVTQLDQVEEVYNKLLAAYKQRDLSAMHAISDEAMSQGDQALARKFEKTLIDDRNHRMLERMEQHLGKGGTFVAVGALHLPGEQGLIRLLRQKGYQLEAIY
jgi:uncharacterized protein YbaP (TraB family)